MPCWRVFDILVVEHCGCAWIYVQDSEIQGYWFSMGAVWFVKHQNEDRYRSSLLYSMRNTVKR